MIAYLFFFMISLVTAEIWLRLNAMPTDAYKLAMLMAAYWAAVWCSSWISIFNRFLTLGVFITLVLLGYAVGEPDAMFVGMLLSFIVGFVVASVRDILKEASQCERNAEPAATHAPPATATDTPCDASVTALTPPLPIPPPDARPTGALACRYTWSDIRRIAGWYRFGAVAFAVLFTAVIASSLWDERLHEPPSASATFEEIERAYASRPTLGTAILSLLLEGSMVVVVIGLAISRKTGVIATVCWTLAVTVPLLLAGVANAWWIKQHPNDPAYANPLLWATWLTWLFVLAAASHRAVQVLKSAKLEPGFFGIPQRDIDDYLEYLQRQQAQE